MILNLIRRPRIRLRITDQVRDPHAGIPESRGVAEASGKARETRRELREPLISDTD